MNRVLFCVIAVSFIIVSCTTAPSKKDPVSGKGDSVAIEKSGELLEVINTINANSPDDARASFVISGNTGNKKFKFEGIYRYEKKGFANVFLMDYIFKSPIVKFYRDGSKLYFYYPSDKKLLVDDALKIDLNRYSGIHADFDFLFRLFTGHIPVLKGAGVKNCVQSGTDGFFLILENNDFYESIFFKKNRPEKILLMHKLTKKKAEIYIDSMATKGKSAFIKKCRIIAPEMNLKVNVSFSGTRINSGARAQKINLTGFGKGIEIIKVN